MISPKHPQWGKLHGGEGGPKNVVRGWGETDVSKGKEEKTESPPTEAPTSRELRRKRPTPAEEPGKESEGENQEGKDADDGMGKE